MGGIVYSKNGTNKTGSVRRTRSLGLMALAIGWSALSIGCASPETKAPPTALAPAPAPVKADESAIGDKSPMHKAKSDSPTSIDDWWPNRLDLRVLKENAPKGDPIDKDFNYVEAFGKLDLGAVKKDIEKALTTSQEWWPADFGHYGGLMIRLAWHSAGTYRVTDGRGGSHEGIIRFAPLNSWPDNVSLDKARRLLWPLKQKYGRSLSWADLMVLTGNVALESMGFKTLGFGGGRVDIFEPTDINWGPETEWLADERFSEDGKKLEGPVGATQMGLIYVNPEGPGGKPDPLAAAEHIRLSFGLMAMNDEETVALIAGGHTLGKAHGAHKPADCVGPEPEAAPLEAQGLGWKNKCGTGKGADTVTSGLEGAWTSTPVTWSHEYLSNLFGFEWELTKSPAGAQQWEPKGDVGVMVPDAHDPKKLHKPIMFTTDLSLKEDPKYRVIAKRFLDNPKEFEAAFAKAWFKLTHRDMGPHARLLGAQVPEAQLWQDPVPAVDYKLVGTADIAALKREVLSSGLSIPQLVTTAWASASTYRDTDMRGGANGARVRLAPQKDWQVNQPAELAKVLPVLEQIQEKFNSTGGKKKISLADLIVLAGCAAVEEAAKQAGATVKVPFTPGRTDATQEMTDAASFAVLEPKADGFRNYLGEGNERTAAELLVDKADFLTLTAPEMTVLLGGMRSLNTNVGSTQHGVFTDKPGTLSNDFFVNLLDMSVEWQKSKGTTEIYEAKDRKTGEVKWTGTSVDLVIGSNSQLRAIAEVYAAAAAKEKFVTDFAAVWSKVMMLDRFDLERR
jgi:catalase-peroxidase